MGPTRYSLGGSDDGEFDEEKDENSSEEDGFKNAMKKATARLQEKSHSRGSDKKRRSCFRPGKRTRRSRRHLQENDDWSGTARYGDDDEDVVHGLTEKDQSKESSVILGMDWAGRKEAEELWTGFEVCAPAPSPGKSNAR